MKTTLDAPGDTAGHFLIGTLEPMAEPGAFDVVNERLVRIDVDGHAWIKRGTVVAYHGGLRFHLEPVLQAEAMHLSGGPVRSAISREAVPISRVEGRGTVYVSNDGRHNHLFELDGDAVYFASSSLLAFESTVEHELKMLGSIGFLAGGLFAVRLSGHGRVAFSVHGQPLTMRVTSENPVSADPTAVVGWTDGLWPELKTDLDMGSLIAHGGGEPIQMLFRGDGYVIVNARTRMEAVRAGVLNRLLSQAKTLFV